MVPCTAIPLPLQSVTDTSLVTTLVNLDSVSASQQKQNVVLDSVGTISKASCNSSLTLLTSV